MGAVDGPPTLAAGSLLKSMLTKGRTPVDGAESYLVEVLADCLLYPSDAADHLSRLDTAGASSSKYKTS